MDSAETGFVYESTRQLAIDLTEALVKESSLNEYLELTLPLVGQFFGLSRVCLVDYQEQTDHFDLLHFEGYPTGSIRSLTRSFNSMELKKGLTRRKPFWSSQQPLFLLIPFSLVSVLVFSATMGFLWLATVPPTSGLVAVMFGTRYMAMLYGIVFLGHQVGSFIGVWLGGWLYDRSGSYDLVWWLGAALGVMAAILHWLMSERPVKRLVAENF